MEKERERWDRKRLWIDYRWCLFLSDGWLPSTTTALTPVLHSLARNECRTMEWQEVLHKCYFVFRLGKLHQQRLRYSPSCLRFSARTSGNGAEVSNQGPGCDTCCSRTPGTSAHDTGFEHRSPTLAWAEPPLLTRSACRSTPNQSYECKIISRRRRKHAASGTTRQLQRTCTAQRERALRDPASIPWHGQINPVHHKCFLSEGLRKYWQ